MYMYYLKSTGKYKIKSHGKSRSRVCISYYQVAREKKPPAEAKGVDLAAKNPRQGLLETSPILP